MMKLYILPIICMSLLASFGNIAVASAQPGDTILTNNVVELRETVSPQGFAHPGISCSAETLAVMREKVIAGGVGFWDQAAGESADSVIWGASPIPGHSVIWGSAVIWGDAVIWGSSVIWGNAVVGSAVDASNKTVIWGSTATVIWGSSWADTDTVF